MLCPKCGKEAYTSADKCQYCGAVFNSSSIADSENVVLKKKKTKKIMFLVLVVVAIVASYLVYNFVMINKYTNQDFIIIDNEPIPSLKYIVGEKKIISSSEFSKNSIGDEGIILSYKTADIAEDDILKYILSLSISYKYELVRNDNIKTIYKAPSVDATKSLLVILESANDKLIITYAKGSYIINNTAE